MGKDQRNTWITNYFLDFDGNKLSERDYLILIRSTIYPEATKSIVKEAIKHESLNDCDDTIKLAAISKELKESIRKLTLQKVSKIFNPIKLSNKRIFKSPPKIKSCSDTTKKKSMRILDKSQCFKVWKTETWGRRKKPWSLSLKANKYGGRRLRTKNYSQSFIQWRTLFDACLNYWSIDELRWVNLWCFVDFPLNQTQAQNSK